MEEQATSGIHLVDGHVTRMRRRRTSAAVTVILLSNENILLICPARTYKNVIHSRVERTISTLVSIKHGIHANMYSYLCFTFVTLFTGLFAENF